MNSSSLTNINKTATHSPQREPSAVVLHYDQNHSSYNPSFELVPLGLPDNSQFSPDGAIPLSARSIEPNEEKEITTTQFVTAFKTAQQTVSIRLSGAETGSLRTVSKDLVDYATDKDMESDVHIISVPDLIARFQSDTKVGLTSAEADIRLQANGKNMLSPPRAESVVIKLLKLFFGGFNWLLIASGILLILSWEPLGEPNPNPTNYYIGIVLFIVVIIGVCFSAYQVRKSSNIMKSFKNMIPPHAHTLRDGEWKDVPAANLQIGDIVKIEIGQKVPADLRLFFVNNLKLDNSMLTGESDPVVASLKCTSRNYLETKNLAFFGSSAVEGSGIGVVVSIGDATVMGKISSLTGEQGNSRTSLHVELDRFVLLVCIAALITGVVCTIGWAAWLRVAWPVYLTWQSLIVTLLSVIVAFVPEGLPLAVTMTLSIVAKRMQQHNVLIKDLATIETFNIITLVCSDKTGTLTLNKMSVSSLVWGLKGENDSASIAQHAPPPNNPQADAAYYQLFRCATMCNGATKQATSENGVEVASLKGDASDKALYTFCDSFHNVANQQNLNHRLAVLPFNSKNKYMLSIHNLDANLGDRAKVLYAKGAPEIILAMCDKVLNSDGSVRAMSDEDRRLWSAQQERLGAQGERVLGFSMVRLPAETYPETHVFNIDAAMSGDEKPNYPTCGLVFLGLISLMDPPRAEVPGALAKCRSAHIRVAMVTGDHPTTGEAIARQIGLLTYPQVDRFDVRQDALDRLNLVLITDGKEMGKHVPLSSTTSSTTPTAVGEEQVRLFTDSEDRHPVQVSVHRDGNGDKLDDFSNDPNYYLYTAPQDARLKRGIVIAGSQIPLLDSMLWTWIFRHDEIVFARTTPEQKLQIVMEAQSRGEKVAVTGDGVNDAPALRKANLGIAMQAGSEVAREAGHIILMDNNFNSIVAGLELGRVVFDNLKKVCIYLLPAGTFSEMLTVFVFLFVGIQSMLSNFQMLMISVCTDVCVSVAMVNERAESDIMTRKPRRSDERLVDLKLLLTAYLFQGVIQFFAATINFFWYCHDQGLPFEAVYNGYNWGSAYPDSDPTTNPNGLYYGIDTNVVLPEILYVGESIFFVTLVITQWGNALAVRTRTQSILTHNPVWGPHSNPHLVIGFIGAFLFLILFTEVSFFQNLFYTRPVPIKYAMVAVVWGFAIVILDETRKYIVRNYPNSIVAKVAW